MKNIFSPFTKLIAVAACALTLGSCSRAEYAMLPKGSSYHGVMRVATPIPAAAKPAAPTAETVVAATPENTPEAAKAATPAARPVAKAAQLAAPAATNTPGTTAIVAAPARKLTAFQRIALNTVNRKVERLMQKSGAARQHDNTASTARSSGISGNLRIGLILLLVGLLVGLLNGLIGTIIAIIGLIFIILWLLDQI